MNRLLKIQINLSLLLLLLLPCYAQSQVYKDLDNDGIADSVVFDYDYFRIICKLSSKKFKQVASKPIPELSSHTYISETKNGFELIVPYMRGGFSNQFQYDKSTKNIQLIGMSRYELGAGPGDGSGESSINLLTGNYTGNWNYFDYQADSLIRIPTIKQKMFFKSQSLQNYDGQLQSAYGNKCAALYEEHKKKMQQR